MKSSYLMSKIKLASTNILILINNKVIFFINLVVYLNIIIKFVLVKLIKLKFLELILVN